jgi:hypothetical protein
MHVASDDLALHFSTIRENLDNLRKSIASGALREAMQHAAQVNYLTEQLTAVLAG